MIPIGRHNIIVGDNESGKTTLCQLMALFSGGNHWEIFNKRFTFCKNANENFYVKLKSKFLYI